MYCSTFFSGDRDRWNVGRTPFQGEFTSSKHVEERSEEATHGVKSDFQVDGNGLIPARDTAAVRGAHVSFGGSKRKFAALHSEIKAPF